MTPHPHEHPQPMFRIPEVDERVCFGFESVQGATRWRFTPGHNCTESVVINAGEPDEKPRCNGMSIDGGHHAATNESGL